jgi:lysozyme
MPSSGVLKEFLVKIGFKVDNQQFKNFQESMGKTANTAVDLTKNFVKLGEASAIAGVGIVATLAAAAGKLQSLAFASQQTGASVKELDALGYAASRVGLSVEQMSSAYLGFATAVRSNRGLQAHLSDFGVDQNANRATQMMQLVSSLRNKPHDIGAQIAGQYGIDENTLNQLENNGPEFWKAFQERQDQVHREGIDQQGQARAGVEFMDHFAKMKGSIGDLGNTIAASLMPPAEKAMDWITGFTEKVIALDGKTGGLSSKLIGLAIAVKALIIPFAKLLGFKMLGGKLPVPPAAASIAAGEAGGAAVAGGEAAAGGAAGSGLSALLKQVAGFSARSTAGMAAGAGGTAVAGEVAAGGAVAAGEVVAGGGIIAAATAAAPILIPLIVGAAAIAAVAWVAMNPAQARKAAGWVKDEANKGIGWLNKELPKPMIAAKKAIDYEKKALPGQIRALDGKAIELPAQAALAAYHAAKAIANKPEQFEIFKLPAQLMESAAAFTAQMEGHVKNGYGLYRDIAGKLTVGFGHLVKQGEDFSGGLDRQGALALLAKDLQSASSSVKGLVHANLGANQMKALSDLVFNIGPKAFANSTLLRELNAGHMENAARHFADFDKAHINGQLAVVAGLRARRDAEAQLFRSPDKSVVINQKTDIHVEGGNAAATGKEVALQQSRVHADIIRNFSGAIQ